MAKSYQSRFTLKQFCLKFPVSILSSSLHFFLFLFVIMLPSWHKSMLKFCTIYSPHGASCVDCTEEAGGSSPRWGTAPKASEAFDPGWLAFKAVDGLARL